MERRLKTTVIVGVIILASASGLAAGMIIKTTDPSSATATIVKQPPLHKFQLFYPTGLPSGFDFDRSSVSQTDQVVSYIVSYNQKPIFVSLQPLPDKSVVNDFETQKLSLPEEIPSSVGNAVVGQVHGTTVASITTGKTWVLVTSQTSVEKSVLAQIIGSLKPAT
jgi:hypothetical protein